MDYTSIRYERGNHRALIGRTGHVFERDDFCSVAVTKDTKHIGAVNPPSRLDEEFGILVLDERGLVRLALAHPV